MAAKNGHNATVKKIVDLHKTVGHKHNIQADTNNEGETALMLAAKHGYGSIVKTLVSQGADIHHKNKAGESALTLAEKNGFALTRTILKEGNSDKMTDFARRVDEDNSSFLFARSRSYSKSYSRSGSRSGSRSRKKSVWRKVSVTKTF